MHRWRIETLVLLIALVCALLPTSFLASWTNPLSLIVSVPAAPITHFGRAARDVLRPYQTPWAFDAPEAVALRSELELYKTLYAQASLDRELLERSLQAMRAMSARGGGPVRLVECSVIGIGLNAGNSKDAVLRVNAGGALGLQAGSPVFFDNDSIVGLVGTDVSSLGASVVPAHRLSGIAVRLVPAQFHDTDISRFPGAVLRPTGHGTWLADVASSVELTIGMTARLADERWPRIALGARLGEVIAVEPIEQAPLARRVEVRPIVAAEAIATVMIAVPEEAQ